MFASTLLTPAVMDVSMLARQLRRLWRQDSGQDVVEYALLAALIGLAAYGGFSAIQNAISSSYITWDNGQQNLWEPLNPGAYGS